ncbi:hypothetical protein OF122_02760 [Pelagibacterium flavum]|uniref:TfoX N-terminal domain-containing protein n=1 Tax=Pelagibacterium flavum TaxID=2984530 RepID=A0ABY6IU64_9HYPH|nr:hypothetical protein [Pelagibacterium sp. YIM 151497]MAN78129.1 hypothetical protein [Hyphomicrobiales bacterium]UYQ72720.1 hypothetical protein OF122_02760 [Pelagibacterium sp. YIM 151497]|tara:strand:- start:1350 stop:1709 length:360 start_codon:yes stop_codon:yes gene_type:complete
MAMPDHTPDPQVVAASDAMIAGVPGVVRKGAQMPYVSINGNMYASVSQANVIGLRLGKADLAKFLEAFETTLFEGVPGHFMKEYGAVPHALLAQPDTLRAWFARSYAHASALKPKATKR